MIIFLLLYLNFPLDLRYVDRDALAAIRAGRRALADVVAGIATFPSRSPLASLHWLALRLRRRRDADLPRPRSGQHHGAPRARRIPTYSRTCMTPSWEGARRASASKDDDGYRDHGRPAADHVEQRYRLRDHATHRRADDRRHGLVDVAHADRDSGDLRIGQRIPVRPAGRRAVTRMSSTRST